MELNDIKKAAADFAATDEIQNMPHYDDVQLALLKKADELKLSWKRKSGQPSEVNIFSEAVHKAKNQSRLA